MRILVIEDEPTVSSFIKEGLEAASFEVELAYDGLIGQRLALSRDYDVVLLDIVIPGINGFDLCKILKEEKPVVPVMMLTTMAATADKVLAFECGADDYLLKPFAFEELTARLKVLAKRGAMSATAAGPVLKFDTLRLDLRMKVAMRDGKEIKLSAKEFKLLEFFMRHPEEVISRNELAEKIWGIKFETNTNVVEVYINMLRNKIDRDFEPKLLHNRFGLGYVLHAGS